ncbi:MAG: IS30 family transposase [Nitrospira sp.]|nr:IS30 family transposase [Nitrospira sp.]
MPYHHLTLEERLMIAPMRILGWSIRSIASQLGRAPSTISRELRRNRDGTGAYAGYWAHRDAQRRRRAGRPSRLTRGVLATYVQEKRQSRWSPEQIAHRVRLDYPHASAMRISHQMIYTWLAEDHQMGGAWSQSLRHHRRRRKRYGSGPRAPRMRGRVSLADRPAIVDRRGRMGDWDGDLVVGQGQRGFVATHVDRRSRFLLAAKVSRRTAAQVTEATRKFLCPLPSQVRQTLTVDNGSEWAMFRRLQRTLGLQVYFAAPYAAWERGTNENTNGLLRDYFPKQTDFSRITAQQLASVVTELNNRPRKCLAYRTPAEVFARAPGVALQP